MSARRAETAVIFLGGAAGALARVGLLSLAPAPAAAWPWAVFLINLAGAALLGGLMEDPERPSPGTRALLGAGFCGAFTTFSTLQLELLDMLRAGHLLLAGAYAAASLSGGILAVMAGARLFRGRA